MSRDIPLVLIDPDPQQPRQHFDPTALEDLAQSMATTGLAVPLLLRPTGERFTIIHGERRWRAAQQLGWASIAADVRDVDADAAYWLALVENVQRADLSPIEEARAYQGRLAAGMTQQALGERIGKGQSYIAQKLRLLRLPEPLPTYLAGQAFSEGHARQLLRLEGMYHGLTTPLDADSLMQRPDEPEGSYVFTMLRDYRIEDQPPLYFPTLSRVLGPTPTAAIPLLARGCQAFATYVATYGEPLPLWHLGAWWWSTCTVALGLSVALLHDALDNWQQRMHGSTVWWLLQHGEAQPEPPDAEWYGHLSDLRHGRLLPLLQGGDPAVDTLGREAIERVEYLTLPTMMQAWGSQAEEGRELLAAERETS